MSAVRFTDNEGRTVLEGILIGGGAGGGGDFTRIASVTLGVAGTISFTAIPATFSHLMMFCACQSSAAVANEDLRQQFNGDTGANYYFQHAYWFNGSTSIVTANANTSAGAGIITGSTATVGASTFLCHELWLPFYATAGMTRTGNARGGGRWDTGANGTLTTIYTWTWNSTVAVNRWDLLSATGAGGNLAAGSSAILYGVT